MKISTSSLFRLTMSLLLLFSFNSSFSKSEFNSFNYGISKEDVSNTMSTSAAVSAGQTTFAVIGDFGNKSSDETAVAILVKSWTPDFVVTTGDNRYGSINFDEAVGKDYCEFIRDAANGNNCNGGTSSTNAFFPSTGNHDYTDGGKIEEYLSYFKLPGTEVQSSNTSNSELYYDFIQGPIHFFVIDSYTATSDGEMQKNWLQSQMAASTSIWKVVYFHHPPYSSSSNHGSTVAMQWPFADWGADVVLNGHDHSYERIHHDGIVYFVNGLGGATKYGFSDPIPESAFQYNSEFGAQRVVADEETMSFSFINSKGVLIDNYTLYKNVVGNNQPIFTSNPITGKPDAEIGIEYNSSIFNDASDTDNDPLIFAKISGPDWLRVSIAGILSGIPENIDQGSNTFTVQVSDSRGGTAQAELQINVINQPPPPASGIIESQIKKSMDDVEEKLSDGYMYVTSTDIELGNDPWSNGDQQAGLYFRNIYIPQGAHISNAYIEFTTDETGNVTTDINVKAHNIANAPEFTTANYDLTTRPTTSNFLTWNIPEWNTTGEKHQTPDISGVIQELIDKPDWVYNNNIAIVIAGIGTRTAEAFDGNPANAAKLYIEYDNELCDGIDNDGDGLVDEGYLDSDNDGIADCVDNTKCEPYIETFSKSILNATSTENDVTLADQLPQGARNVSFSISGLDQKTGGKPSGRYIEEVTVNYTDQNGETQNSGVYTADNGSSVLVSISDFVQSISVTLADGYEGSTGSSLSINLSEVNFCVDKEQCNDDDGDGVCNEVDQCEGHDDLIDADADGIPDGCDECIDGDGDGICDKADNCPDRYNPDQEPDFDCDGVFATDDCDDNDPNVATSNKIDTDGDGVFDCEDVCPGFDDAVDLNNNGIPDGCDVPDCTPTIENLAPSVLTHSGAGTSTITFNIPTGGQDIEFTISDIDERTGGKPSNRFIEKITVIYEDGNGIEQNYELPGGTSSVNVIIPGVVQSVTVSLTDGYNENSNNFLSVDLSAVSYCASPAESQLKSGNPASSTIDDIESEGLFENEFLISVYPSPFSSEIYIKININDKFEKVIVNILDLAGKTLLKEVYGPQKIIALNNLNLQTGTYFIRVQLDSFVKTVRVIKIK